MHVIRQLAAYGPNSMNGPYHWRSAATQVRSVSDRIAGDGRRIMDQSTFRCQPPRGGGLEKENRNAC
jgi:hypothetical protein